MDSLGFLYKTRIGRILLKPLVSRPFSQIAGRFLDSRFSKVFIKSFVRDNSIIVDDYQTDNIECFNDFFCRKIKEGLRPVSMNGDDLIAPCDGLLSVYKISGDTVLNVKQSAFTITDLLKDDFLAASFNGGYALVYRLCVDNYHRYIYFDSGKQLDNKRIDGIYHTVRPVALSAFPVFVQNTREYAVIDTGNFGRAVQMEVGAMLVGRIVNHNTGSCEVTRGAEKGYFEYGGSTVIVLIKDGTAGLHEKFMTGEEVPVLMGEVIGRKRS